MGVQIKKWADVLHIISGKNQRDVASESGQYPIYGSGGIMGYANNYLCEAGTTIIGRKGTINRPIFVNERFWNVDTAFGVFPGKTLHPKFLFYFCQSFNFKVLDKSTTIPSLAKRDLLNIEMPVPPLPDQERIVSRIEELFSQLDASVAELKTAKERLKMYRQAVLKEAFDQCKEFVPLSSLGDLGRGKSKHRPRNDPKLFEDGKYPFIQTGDVKAASKYISNYSKMYGEFGLRQSKLWPKGTLCITIAANIAETAFLGIDACFPDSVVGFTPYDRILPEFVRYFIESQKQRLWAFAPATAQKNINLDTLEKLTVPYCPDIQAKIVEEIDSKITICDNIEKTVDTALQQAEALRQSILKKAFEGGFI